MARCVFVGLAIMSSRVVTAAQDSSECANSTVEDAFGPNIASQAESFLAKLQKTVRAADKKQFALLVHYPVRVFRGRHSVEVSSASQFVHNYSSIVTPVVRQAILKQSGPCLFANSQGIMVGSGQIWFQKERNGKMKIITINSNAPNEK